MEDEKDDRADALKNPEDYFNDSDVTDDECDYNEDCHENPDNDDELSTDIPDTAPCSIDREARMLTAAPDVVEEEEVAVEVVTGQAPVSEDCFVVFRAPARPSTSASSNMTSSVCGEELRRLDNFDRGDGASGQCQHCQQQLHQGL